MLDGLTSLSSEAVQNRGASAELTRSIDASATQASAVDGSGIDGADIDGADIDGADIDGADIDGADIDGADIDGADIDGADIDGADIDGADIDGADIDGADIDGADIDGAGIDAPGIDASGVDAPGVDAPGIDAPGVDASGIDAPGVDAPGIDASGIDAPGVDAPGIDAPGIDASGIDASGIDAPGIEAPGIDGADIGGSGVDASGVDASGIDASGIDASGIDAPGIDASAIDALHARFLRRKREQSAWDAEEARDLRRADQQQIWLRYGCVTLLEYLERFCGIEPRTALERIRVSFALTDLPLLEASLEDGTFQFSHVKELTRVVVADTEEEWVRHARGLTYREVQQAVAGHSRGDRPTDPTRPDERRRCVSFRLKPSTKARMLAVLRDIERARGDRFVDDDDAVNCLCDLASSALADFAGSALDMACTPSGDLEAAELTARSATEASATEASASAASASAASASAASATETFATATSAAATSATATSAAGASATEASATEASASGACAAEASKSERTTSPRGATAAIATATSTFAAAGSTSVAGGGNVRRVSRRPCCAPAQVWITTEGHAFANGVEIDDAERDTLLCDATIMGHVDEDSARPQPAFSARKRRRILARDMHQCRVPGCRLRHHLDVHHIIRREDGGDHSDENLITLCSGHHRLHHGGLLQISGRAPAALIFKRVFADDERSSRPRGREASAPRDEQTSRPRGRESSENVPPAQRMRVELAELRRS